MGVKLYTIDSEMKSEVRKKERIRIKGRGKSLKKEKIKQNFKHMQHRRYTVAPTSLLPHRCETRGTENIRTAKQRREKTKVNKEEKHQEQQISFRFPRVLQAKPTVIIQHYSGW